MMTLKLLAIVVGAAAFSWGFSTLVQHSDQVIGPEGQRYACEQWSGNDCARQFER